MCRRRPMLLALVWTAAAAGRLAGQDSRLVGRLDPPALTAVQGVLDSARVANLPTEPLVAKALEGVAKRAGNERIVLALRSLLRDLATARRALGPDAGGSELAAGATAVRAGVDAGALERLRGARKDLTAPLGVLADLVVHGVPVDTAVAAIRQLASRGAPDGEFTGLARHVLRDVGVGVPPGLAATARAGALGAPRRPTHPGKPRP
ncbi:MAG: hypothetical protein ACREOF_09320 [Gemmatimonadales bacterium]